MGRLKKQRELVLEQKIGIVLNRKGRKLSSGGEGRGGKMLLGAAYVTIKRNRVPRIQEAQ
jgi:hypothetical protein